jgi:hypothetical protein
MRFKEFQYICKLNTEYLEDEFGKLSTNELILTDERDIHIKQRHEKDYKIFHQCVTDIIEIPDLILKDSKNKNTVFYIKYIEETNINIVVRLSLETDNDTYKNSIITAYRLGEKTLKRFRKNHKTIYNRE